MVASCQEMLVFQLAEVMVSRDRVFGEMLEIDRQACVCRPLDSKTPRSFAKGIVIRLRSLKAR